MYRGERGGVAAVLAVLVACALAGAVAGYAVAHENDSQPPELASARPLAASSPSIPSDPVISYLPDPDEYPPLSTDPTYVTKQLGIPPSMWEYDIPAGLEVHNLGPGQRRWTLRDDPDFTYSIRVAIINLPIATRDAARNRLGAVRDGSDHVQLVAISDDDLQFTYVLDGHLRYQHSWWLPRPDSTLAAFELTVSGRESDRPGLDALLDHMVETTQQVG